MSKKYWIWIVCGILFPPIFFIPLIYYYLYLPYKEGVIRGSRVSFYFGTSVICSIIGFAALPKDLSKNAIQLSNIHTTQIFLIISFLASLLTIFMLFKATRNDPDQKDYLPIRKFKIDKLFSFCLLYTFVPYTLLLLKKNYSLDDISHPMSYAIAVAFTNKYYFLVALGFLTITILTGILEESFFRGILLRDYFKLKPPHQKLLLFFAALYFGLAHLPLYFLGPFIFALFMNRIRLAYKNLAPSMILHALWNANLTIAILIALSSATTSRFKSVEEEMVATSVAWEHKDTILINKYFAPEKSFGHDKFEKFKGRYLTVLVLPDTTKENSIQSMVTFLNKPVFGHIIEQAYPAKDWESKHFKKSDHEFRCSKATDVCFRDQEGFSKEIVHGISDNPDIF